MNRVQKLKLNSTMSILQRIAIIVSGLIIPRVILNNFGSESYGMVSSINQFLAIITFLDLGVGSVVKSALYRPLAQKNKNEVNSVLVASRKYFRKIVIVLIVYVTLLVVFYPLLVDSSYGYLSTSLLIISMSISLFGQYYFGIINELLLSSNQQDYIQLASEVFVIFLNLLVTVLLISLGFRLEHVKLGAGLIYLIRPIFLSLYVNKHFTIDYSIKLESDPLPQKWNGVGQHIAYTLQNNTDIVFLTLFSSLENVSIYSVYNMIVSAMKMLLSSITMGIQSFFGDLYANDEVKLLNKYFDKIEWFVHTSVTFLYAMTVVLINSFILLYTSGVNDISYEAPVFSFLLVLSGAAYSIRSPYQSLVFSVGHFKETQLSSYIEAGLNIVISIILINNFGLIGVAIGTLISMVYRTLYLVIYLSKNIVYRSLNTFIKNIAVDFISFGLIILTGTIVNNTLIVGSIIDWIINAALIGITSLILISIVNFLFYRDIILGIIQYKKK